MVIEMNKFGEHELEAAVSAQMSGTTYHNIWYKALVKVRLNKEVPVGTERKRLRARIRKAVQLLLIREYCMDLCKNVRLVGKKVSDTRAMTGINETAENHYYMAQNANQDWQRERAELESDNIRFFEIKVLRPHLLADPSDPVFHGKVMW